MDGGTAAVNGMEERDRVDASTNIVVDPWLSLVGSISALARLTLTDCVILFSYSTVAVTGRKHLRPRPVDFVILFSVFDPWLLLAGEISALARLILLFYFVTRPVAATGRRKLRPRPVDFVILFIFVTQPVVVTGRRHLRHRPVEFIHPC